MTLGGIVIALALGAILVPYLLIQGWTLFRLYIRPPKIVYDMGEVRIASGFAILGKSPSRLSHWLRPHSREHGFLEFTNARLIWRPVSPFAPKVVIPRDAIIWLEKRSGLPLPFVLDHAVVVGSPERDYLFWLPRSLAKVVVREVEEALASHRNP